MLVQRRKLVIAATSAFIAETVLSQQYHLHGSGDGQPTLPKADPSHEPFAKLQGGTPHHLTADQESQRSFASTATQGPTGRWATKA